VCDPSLTCAIPELFRDEYCTHYKVLYKIYRFLFTVHHTHTHNYICAAAEQCGPLSGVSDGENSQSFSSRCIILIITSRLIIHLIRSYFEPVVQLHTAWLHRTTIMQSSTQPRQSAKQQKCVVSVLKRQNKGKMLPSLRVHDA